jgi:maltooligosyltrehalose trehalohydrolase
LDEEGKDRYADFGRMEQLAKAYTDGFVHSGEYVQFRKRRHGSSSVGVRGDAFVVFNQNHDQVGNRVGGERLSMLVSEERQKLAAAAILLAPYVPMLFMGEEYASDSPFFYFISHSDKDLIKMVVEGRQKEFSNYNWDTAPPNPQDVTTFQRSKLDWEVRRKDSHLEMLNWHRTLISLRKSKPALQNFIKNDLRVNLFGDRGLVLHRQCRQQKQQLLCIFNFGTEDLFLRISGQHLLWNKLIDSREASWMDETKTCTNFPQQVRGEETLLVKGLSSVVYEGADQL